MSTLDVAANPLLKFVERLRRGRLFREESSVDVLGAVSPCAPNNYLPVFLIPFEYGAGPNAKLFPHLGRH
jgi:hypothetical protein